MQIKSMLFVECMTRAAAAARASVQRPDVDLLPVGVVLSGSSWPSYPPTTAVPSNNNDEPKELISTAPNEYLLMRNNGFGKIGKIRAFV